MAGSGLGDMWTQLSSTLAGLMFIITMLRPYMPEFIHHYIDRLIQRIMSHFNNNVQIIVPEFSLERRNRRSDLFLAVEVYLSSLATTHARRLVADMSMKSKKPLLSMDNYEKVKDEYLGVKIEWILSKRQNTRTSISLYNSEPEEKRFYKLVFPHRHRDTFTAPYIQHVMGKAKQISAVNRKRKLYTNNTSAVWNSVIFEHPASFETLAMDPRKKKEIIDDLRTFSLSKDYYVKIGRAWKRGYLLYGPPGTGKSTMVACIANYLGYDVYDLELTAVKDNNQLRELMIETSSKSVIVIEDIDCSLDLTGQRKKKNHEGNTLQNSITGKEDEDKKGSKVTLSGLLNSIDGLWSGCGSEKIIIFTTNHMKDLDPALIRRGRMDKHIEMSYCSFEAFKVLAKNYLDIKLHCLFDDAKKLLDEVKMTTADVAELLIPKCCSDNNAADTCLKNLIEALQVAKAEADAKVVHEEANAKMVNAEANANAVNEEGDTKTGNEEADAKAGIKEEDAKAGIKEARAKKLKGILRLKQTLMKKFKIVKDESNKAKENLDEEGNEEKDSNAAQAA